MSNQIQPIETAFTLMMYPHGETTDGRLVSASPDSFRYALKPVEIAA